MAADWYSELFGRESVESKKGQRIHTKHELGVGALKADFRLFPFRNAVQCYALEPAQGLGIRSKTKEMVRGLAVKTGCIWALGIGVPKVQGHALHIGIHQFQSGETTSEIKPFLLQVLLFLFDSV